jgi:adenylate cyclase class 2
MSQEIETKVLGVDPQAIKEKLSALGAEKILDTTLTVDWFRTAGSKEGDDQWYLRSRTTSDGKTEVTWKGLSQVLGASRTHKEVNIKVDDAAKVADLFAEINLEHYAHQEKKRTSWVYKDWHFDLDTYPNVPQYLEIEGKDEAQIQAAIALLGLEENEKYPGGERLLISEKYGLNWYEMRF